MNPYTIAYFLLKNSIAIVLIKSNLSGLGLLLMMLGST